MMKLTMKNTFVLVLCILLIGQSAWAFFNGDRIIPANPLQEANEESSPNKLVLTSYDGQQPLEHKQLDLDKEDRSNVELQSNNEIGREKESNSASLKNENEKGTLTPKKDESQKNTEDSKDSKQANGFIGNSNSGGKSSKNNEEMIEIVKGSHDENPYFTTTIADEETVSKPKYDFTIIQKNPKLKVLSTVITVNEKQVENFQNRIQLDEGTNAIRITVKYDDQAQSIVHKEYRIYYAKNDVVFTTSLKDGMKPTSENIEFFAYAHFNEDSVDVTATYDGIELVEGVENHYKIRLKEGNNTVVLNAEHNGMKKKKQINIIYEQKKTSIIIETDLKNQRTSNAEMTFYAEASLEGESLPLMATLNGEKLKEKNHYFSDLLKEGKNSIVLSAKSENDEINEIYTVYYFAEEKNDQTAVVPDDVAGPIIKTDLINNQQIHGTKKNFNVWATDASGKRIQASGVTVHNNNKAVALIWDDSEKSSYRIQLDQGKNTVRIKVWDKDGRITTKQFILYAKNIETGDAIGKATISIDGTTVGLGTIVPPTQVDLQEGVKGAVIMDRFLKNAGFSYKSTGTLEASFYLASIGKAGMANKLKIPSEIDQQLKNSPFTYDPTNYSVDELGEFDLSSGSGWLYSINGDLPNYGLSDAVFLNGDVIQLKFTLTLGGDKDFNNGKGAGK